MAKKKKQYKPYKPPTFKEKQRLCAQRRRKLIENATEAELYFKQLLDNLEVRYCFQKGFIGGDNFCIADFYIPTIRTVVEIDGVYHLHSRQQVRDASKDRYYKSRGFKVFRITNSDAMQLDEDLLERILKL